MPKISILVPIYNVEKYLKECLDSLINQTLDDIEIICLNDGSTDSSVEILEEYRLKDKRIKVINKSNSGYGHSMNIGLNNARGEYIGILESDDFTDKNMFMDLYNLAKEFDADVVKSDWNNYWTTKNLSIKQGRIPARKTNKIINASQDKFLLKLHPSIWSAIYKRDFIEDNGIRFLETKGASYQDTSFHFKVMMCAEKVVLTSKSYVYYRQDNINSSVKSKGKVYAICDEYNEVERFMKSRMDIAKEMQEYIYTIQYRAYFANMLRIDEKYVQDFIGVFSKKFKELYDSGVLGEYFFSKNKKSNVLCLINNQHKFHKIYQSQMKKRSIREKRKKLITVKINSSSASVVVFGKQIVRIGN